MDYMLRAVFIGALCVALGGCAEEITRTDAITSGGQDVVYSHGTAFLRSPGREAFVMASGSTAHGEIKVLLKVHNTSDHNLLFSEDAISASENGQMIAVITAAQQRRQADTRDTWRRAAVAIGGGINAGAAGNSGRASYSGDFRATDQNGETVRGTYSGEVSDSAASQAAIDRANAQTAQGMATASAQHAQELEAIGGELQRTTLQPGESITGWVSFSPTHHQGKRNQIEVKLPLGNEVHTLHFVQSRQ